MTDRLIRTNVAYDRACISKTQAYRLMKLGQFPRPVPIGSQGVAYVEAELQAWITARIQDREAGVGAASRRARAIRAVGGRL